MDKILKLNEKIHSLISAYKEQGELLLKTQENFNNLKEKLKEKEQEIEILKERMRILQLQKGVENLSSKEQEKFKHQIQDLIEKIDIYVQQLK
ncbi:MAG TPA: hypothetical protein VK027_07690 [Chitinophagaceae bacterium]|nr:hypothetical protein [Chitinophagaceae bacterium]